MGQTTPNIGIYIPAAGETNYESSFSSGMVNVDQHDHTGAPTKGVQIATTGLADGSVTYPKLNANVADTVTGIGVDGANPNKLQILGLLKQIYQLAPLADGQLIIGSTGLSPAKAVPTAGSGISITPGAGSLTIAATGLAVLTRQVFIYTGAPQTYTPTPGMKYCDIEILGGGGAGGGAQANIAGQFSGGSGGGAGEYARGIFTAATIGASQVVTIGAAGVGASGAVGGDGGTSSVGALITAIGGGGGQIVPTTAISGWVVGALGGTGGVGGNIRMPGNPGDYAWVTFSNTFSVPGKGGSSQYGAGGRVMNAGSVGGVGLGYGSGGAGVSQGAGAGALVGNNGAAGIVIITEY